MEVHSHSDAGTPEPLPIPKDSGNTPSPAAIAQRTLQQATPSLPSTHTKICATQLKASGDKIGVAADRSGVFAPPREQKCAQLRANMIAYFTPPGGALAPEDEAKIDQLVSTLLKIDKEVAKSSAGLYPDTHAVKFKAYGKVENLTIGSKTYDAYLGRNMKVYIHGGSTDQVGKGSYGSVHKVGVLFKLRLQPYIEVLQKTSNIVYHEPLDPSITLDPKTVSSGVKPDENTPTSSVKVDKKSQAKLVYENTYKATLASLERERDFTKAIHQNAKAADPAVKEQRGVQRAPYAVFNNGTSECGYYVLAYKTDLSFENVEKLNLEQRKSYGLGNVAGLVTGGEDVLSGLAATHKAGIAHTDIKGANIGIQPVGNDSGQYQWVIGDFGGADDKGISNIFGTPPFVPHVDIMNELDAQSDAERLAIKMQRDIFATGRTLLGTYYSAITGLKVDGSDWAQALNKYTLAVDEGRRITGDPTEEPAVQEALELVGNKLGKPFQELLTDMLRPRENRPSSAELCDRWSAAIREMPENMASRHIGPHHLRINSTTAANMLKDEPIGSSVVSEERRSDHLPVRDPSYNPAEITKGRVFIKVDDTTVQSLEYSVEETAGSGYTMKIWDGQEVYGKEHPLATYSGLSTTEVFTTQVDPVAKQWVAKHETAKLAVEAKKQAAIKLEAEMPSIALNELKLDIENELNAEQLMPANSELKEKPDGSFCFWKSERPVGEVFYMVVRKDSEDIKYSIEPKLDSEKKPGCIVRRSDEKSEGVFFPATSLNDLIYEVEEAEDFKLVYDNWVKP